MKQVCTVITVTRGTPNFLQSKPSKVKYKCYNIAWLGICLRIYQANPSQLCYNLYIRMYNP